MRAWLLLVILLAGCSSPTTPVDADRSQAASPPDVLDHTRCGVYVGLFAYPEPMARAYLPEGFSLAPHPLGLPAAAYAAIGVRCQEVNGTALNASIEAPREHFGALWVEPPQAHAGADIHLLPIRGTIGDEALATAFAERGFGTIDHRRVSITRLAQDPAHAATIQFETGHQLVDVHVQATEESSQSEEVHRLFGTEEGLLTGYVDVHLPEAQAWSGVAERRAQNRLPNVGVELFQQPGYGLFIDLKDAALRYTFTDLRNGTA